MNWTADGSKIVLAANGQLSKALSAPAVAALRKVAALQVAMSILRESLGGFALRDSAAFVNVISKDGPQPPSKNNALWLWLNPLKILPAEWGGEALTMAAWDHRQEHITKTSILGPRLDNNFEDCIQYPYFKFRSMTMTPGDHKNKCDKAGIAR